MQAASLFAADDLRIVQTKRPACPEEGVLIRVRACGICSADGKMVSQGHKALIYPRVPGHEISGDVVQSTCSDFQEGDRVQVAPGLYCGRCPYCLRGADNQCLQREILGFTRDGGFAEYVTVPLQGQLQGSLTCLPDQLGFAEATLAEPLACCLNALTKMPVHQDEVVLVAGAGVLGLLFGFAVMGKRAGKLIFSEPRWERRQTALSCGAARVVDPHEEDLGRVINEETDGKGADILFLASSQVGLDDELLDLIARGGRISLFSGLRSSLASSGCDLNQLHYKELEVTGAYGCTAAQNAQAIELISEDREFFQSMITGKVGFEHLQSALKQLGTKGSLKTVLEVHDAG